MQRNKKIGKRLREKFVRDESGSALVEMAISSIVLLATLLGIMQLTMACYTYNAVNEAVRETTRWAIVRGSTCSTNTPNLDHCGATPTDIQNHAQSIAGVNWGPCSSTTCVTVSYMTGTTTTGGQQTTTTWSACSSSCNKPGNLLIVNVNYPYALNMPFLHFYNLNLASTSQMVIAQ